MRADDAALAAELGANSFGLNFVGGPRMIDDQKAFELLQALRDRFGREPMPDRSAFAIPVALVRAPSRRYWQAQWHSDLNYLRIKRFQLYGEDEIDLLSHLDDNANRNDGYWKVMPVFDRSSLAGLSQAVTGLSWKPQAIVLDTASPDKLGGTGQSFNWHWIAEARAAGELDGLPPLILAGGLTPDNVAEAIRIARPYAVDVSSGVEVPGKPGIKDPIKMRDFIQAAQSA